MCLHCDTATGARFLLVDCRERYDHRPGVGGEDWVGGGARPRAGTWRCNLSTTWLTSCSDAFETASLCQVSQPIVTSHRPPPCIVQFQVFQIFVIGCRALRTSWSTWRSTRRRNFRTTRSSNSLSRWGRSSAPARCAGRLNAGAGIFSHGRCLMIGTFRALRIPHHRAYLTGGMGIRIFLKGSTDALRANGCLSSRLAVLKYSHVAIVSHRMPTPARTRRLTALAPMLQPCAVAIISLYCFAAERVYQRRRDGLPADRTHQRLGPAGALLPGAGPVGVQDTVRTGISCNCFACYVG